MLNHLFIYLNSIFVMSVSSVFYDFTGISAWPLEYSYFPTACQILAH